MFGMAQEKEEKKMPQKIDSLAFVLLGWVLLLLLKNQIVYGQKKASTLKTLSCKTIKVAVFSLFPTPPPPPAPTPTTS